MATAAAPGHSSREPVLWLPGGGWGGGGDEVVILFQPAHAQQVLTLHREGMGRKNRLEFLLPECSVTKQRG